MNEASSLADQPQQSISSVAVVGGGFMGSGIAESTAIAGVPVTIYESDPERRPGVTERIGKSLARAVKGGKMDQEALDASNIIVKYAET